MCVSKEPLGTPFGPAIHMALALLLSMGISIHAHADDPQIPSLEMQRYTDRETGGAIDLGTLTVWENRATQEGRTLDLDVVILRAESDTPAPDPVFIFQGGPGLAAADNWRGMRHHWMRQTRDLVFLSQRGTGGSNRLDCDAPGASDDLQGYLDQVFANTDAFVACLDALRENTDLRWYGTATAMADADDLRQALGYTTINVHGGSYGSRAAMEYARRYEAHTRTVLVSGVAPVSFVNPLYHASSAQRALDLICEECAADEACRTAYPDLRARFDQTLKRLADEPAIVTIAHPETGEDVQLTLTRDAFAEAMRLMMYFDSRSIPSLITMAWNAEYSTFIDAALASNARIRDLVAFGMLLCVTCTEDVARIDHAQIEPLTRDTFLGDVRVRQQIELCERWPRSVVPDDHGAPLAVDVPVLMISGRYDPVTPPSFATDAAQHLPHCLHIIAPGSHGVSGGCIDAIIRQVLERGSVDGIDTSCLDAMTAGPFVIPDAP